jgi:hypothetical protein
MWHSISLHNPEDASNLMYLTRIKIYRGIIIADNQTPKVKIKFRDAMTVAA